MAHGGLRCPQHRGTVRRRPPRPLAPGGTGPV